MSSNKKHGEFNVKKSRSLKTKTFFITMILTLIIGLLCLLEGLFLYIEGVVNEDFISVWNMSNAEAVILEEMNVRTKCDEILEIYDSIPDKERGDGTSEEYISKFKPCIDEEFKSIQDQMLKIKNRNGPLNALIIAVDRTKPDRMIYLVDSDKNMNTFVYPGTWDYYDEADLDKLMYGRNLSKVQRKYGYNKRPHAIISTLEKYGLRITGAATLYKKGNYTVMACTENKLDSVISVSRIFLRSYLIILLIITIIASLIGMRLINKHFLRPVNKISKAAKAYSDDRQKMTIERKHFESLDIETGDEIEGLAHTMKNMEKDISEYAHDLTKITAEKERISTELSLASRIQESMLPGKFPPYPERSEFDLYASMVPAKEVGGDFYDFFMIDDDHLGIVIADVSGKGIPAALFMMSSKILIAYSAAKYNSPAYVLEKVNEKVCVNNVSEMFVTVWFGIMEISTGKIRAANAGHEYPIIIDEKGNSEIIRDKHSFVVGGMEGMRYKEYEMELKPGHKLFLYTDGLTEATSADKELFGLENTKKALDSAGSGASAKEVLEAVNRGVDAFVREEEQFDDMTMMCIEYRGKG